MGPNTARHQIASPVNDIGRKCFEIDLVYDCLNRVL